MGFSDKNIVSFIVDVSSFMLNDYRHTNFRREILTLVDKYFGIKKSSFVLYHDDYFLGNDKSSSLLDNITYGISQKSISEFYNKYYRIDDQYINLSLGHSIVRLSDVIKGKSESELEMYHDYYLKYDTAYQVTVGLFYEKQLIGAISLARGSHDTDFTNEELEKLKIIQQFLSNESMKIIDYEKLVLENLALRDQGSAFPIGLIILDDKYTVVYSNDESKNMIKDLISESSVDFRYYFINEVVSNNYVDDSPLDNIFKVGKYKFRVSKKFQADQYSETKEKHLFFFVYLSKNEFAKKKKKNEYFERLTQREKEVVLLIKKGLSNAEIADALSISPYTVKTHVQRLYYKCDVNNKVKLIYKLFKE